MERIVGLEKQYAQVYKDLLEILDKLYLIQQGATLDKKEERTAQVRRQLQMSLDKGGAMLRALDRLGREQRLDGRLPEATTERLLALRLGGLLQKNYQLDDRVSKTITKELELSEQLQRERLNYLTLVDRLRHVSAQIAPHESTPEDKEPQQRVSPDEAQVNQQSDTIEQLLIALKIHGGYDPFI